MQIRTLATIAVLAITPPAGASDVFYLPADPLQGATHFTEKGCDKCHAVEGHGGAFAPDLAHSDFNGSLLDVIAMMWNHAPQMSEMRDDLRMRRSDLTSTEMAELAAYIYYIAYFDSPGGIAEGQRVFSAKGCDNCHRVGNIGKSVGPDLASIKKYVSPIFLAQKMWNHGPSINVKMTELGIAWPMFTGHELVDLMAFLRDASPVTDPERVFMRPGNPMIGKTLFSEKRCIACHEVFGKGTAIGPDLSTSKFHKSVTSVAAVMWNHGPAIWGKMAELGQSYPKFQGNEMADLTAFLYFLRFFERTPSLARGEMLFQQKGCQGCHHFGESEVDGSIALTFTGNEATALAVSTRMWNTSEEMSHAMAQNKLEWPRFKDGELADLAEYIISRSNP